jgi:hypothetical protein
VFRLTKTGNLFAKFEPIRSFTGVFADSFINAPDAFSGERITGTGI